MLLQCMDPHVSAQLGPDFCRYQLSNSANLGMMRSFRPSLGSQGTLHNGASDF